MHRRAAAVLVTILFALLRMNLLLGNGKYFGKWKMTSLIHYLPTTIRLFLRYTIYECSMSIVRAAVQLKLAAPAGSPVSGLKYS